MTLITIKYCIISGLFALAMFSSAQVGRFLSIAALGTAFFSAGLARHFIGGSTAVAFVAMLGTAALVGVLAAGLAASLHESAGLDRVTAGVVTYFLLYGGGLIAAGGGVANAPNTWQAPPMETAVAILTVVMVACVLLMVFYLSTSAGLRALAFSQSPEFAGRFGFSGRAVYLVPLAFGESVAGLAGCLAMYLEGSTSRDYAFQPMLVGITAAGVAQFVGWRGRVWMRLLITLAISSLWCLTSAFGARASSYVNPPEWVANMREGLVALTVAVVTIAGIQAYGVRARRVAGQA